MQLQTNNQQNALSKTEKYEQMLLQLEALLQGETDELARESSLCALLKDTFAWFWVGFYWVRGEELVIGCYQGPLACLRIQKGKGVCGTAWAEKRTIVVEDVHQFPGHIACSALSNSEIVLPLWKGKEVVGVLDIDSEHFATFDQTDAQYLAKVLALLFLA